LTRKAIRNFKHKPTEFSAAWASTPFRRCSRVPGCQFDWLFWTVSTMLSATLSDSCLRGVAFRQNLLASQRQAEHLSLAIRNYEQAGDLLHRSSIREGTRKARGHLRRLVATNIAADARKTAPYILPPLSREGPFVSTQRVAGSVTLVITPGSDRRVFILGPIFCPDRAGSDSKRPR
jgi:hypothetical protein